MCKHGVPKGNVLARAWKIVLCQGLLRSRTQFVSAFMTFILPTTLGVIVGLLAFIHGVVGFKGAFSDLSRRLWGNGLSFTM